MIVYSDNFDEYTSRVALNSSGIKEILKSPAHYKAQFIDKVHGSIDTPALRFGRYTHTAILEPSSYDELLTKDDVNLTEARKVDIEGMKARFFENEECKLYFSRGIAERSFYWDYKGVSCKARLDYISDFGYLIDLKTVRDGSPEAFKRAIYSYGYDIQAAWYLKAFETFYNEPVKFCWVCIEKHPPYVLSVYSASREVIDSGARKCDKAVDIYRKCLASDEWPCDTFKGVL